MKGGTNRVRKGCRPFPPCRIPLPPGRSQQGLSATRSLSTLLHRSTPEDPGADGPCSAEDPSPRGRVVQRSCPHPEARSGGARVRLARPHRLQPRTKHARKRNVEDEQNDAGPSCNARPGEPRRSEERATHATHEDASGRHGILRQVLRHHGSRRVRGASQGDGGRRRNCISRRSTRSGGALGLPDSGHPSRLRTQRSRQDLFRQTRAAVQLDQPMGLRSESQGQQAGSEPEVPRTGQGHVSQSRRRQDCGHVLGRQTALHPSAHDA